MNENTYQMLKKFDTPTICNAIEVAQEKRGFDRFTRKTILSSAPEEGSVVGFARTAQIAGMSPPEAEPEVIRKRRMSYYKYMAESAKPSVVVIEDTDFPDCVGAFWGEINATVHKGFGLEGAITNGVMRDLGDLPGKFPIMAGSIGPSHAHVHLKAIDVPVEIFGLRVEPGEIIHADRHGAIVIPPEILDDLEDAVEKLLKTEAMVLEPARSPDFDFEAFAEAWAKFESART